MDALEKELAPEKTYSFLQNGTTCSSSVGLAIASIDPEFGKFGTLDLRGVLSTSVDLIQQNFPKATAYVAQLFSDGPDALAKSIKASIPELKLNTVAPYQVYDWAEAHRYSPEDGKLLPSGQSAPAITDTSPIELQAAHSGLAAEVAAALQHAGVPDFNNDIFVF